MTLPQVLFHLCGSGSGVGVKGKRESPEEGRKVTLIRQRRRESSEGSRWRGEGRNV